MRSIRQYNDILGKLAFLFSSDVDKKNSAATVLRIVSRWLLLLWM